MDDDKLRAALDQRDEAWAQLRRIGSIANRGHGLECGSCGLSLDDCNALPLDESPQSSYFCGGRIARAFMSRPA